jgi:hypothetical protein
MSEPWPYNLPIFRRAHRALSPDGTDVAEIGDAREVSMSNPTIGTLTLSSGLHLDDCNPSFIWSDDSRFLAVPRYFLRYGFFRRQRMAVVDVAARRVLVSPQTAFYFQPESFNDGVLIATREPSRRPAQVRWRLPEHLTRFAELRSAWSTPRTMVAKEPRT